MEWHLFITKGAKLCLDIRDIWQGEGMSDWYDGSSHADLGPTL